MDAIGVKAGIGCSICLGDRRFPTGYFTRSKCVVPSVGPPDERCSGSPEDNDTGARHISRPLMNGLM